MRSAEEQKLALECLKLAAGMVPVGGANASTVIDEARRLLAFIRCDQPQPMVSGNVG